jgi:hypothetical protein
MARMVVRSKDWRPRSGDVVEGCEMEVLEADAKRVSFILYSTWRTEYSLGSFCGPTVKSFPVCADPSLVLYKGRYGELFLLPSAGIELTEHFAI